MLKDFVELVFPTLCPVCEEPLPKSNALLCPVCFEGLPQTGFHDEQENPAKRVFYGRFDFHAVYSAFHFSKGNSVQHILHRIKYKGATALAEQLGEWYGTQLLKKNIIHADTLFVPVPLHPKKKYKRGYNQALHLAIGLAKACGGEAKECLQRNENSSSQTKKNRFARWENVENLFEPLNSVTISKQSVYLVDDVLTTGATLEACARAIRTTTDRQIQALTLAYAGMI